MSWLSCFESISDINEGINILIYITDLNLNLLYQKELNQIISVAYNCLKTISKDGPLITILNFCQLLEHSNCLQINTFKVYIRDSWFFQLILLSSLKHSKDVSAASGNENKIQLIYRLMKHFQPTRQQSIYLLKILNNTIKKNKYLIDNYLASRLLMFGDSVALSPIDGFKQYSYTISKIALLRLNSTNEISKRLLDLNLVPLRGVETKELLPFIRKYMNNDGFIRKVVLKVINMFSNNIESREGSFIYKSILCNDFEKWKTVIWPLFFEQILNADCESEFFQCLVKYWIPHTMNVYQVDFLNLILASPIANQQFKGHVIFEAKRKQILEDSSTVEQCLRTLISRDSTMPNLALKIISVTRAKSSKSISINDLELIKYYLYNQNSKLAAENLTLLHKILYKVNQLEFDVNEEIRILYGQFLTDLYNFAVKSIESDRIELGAQLLTIMWMLVNSNQRGKENEHFCRDILKEQFISNKFYNLIHKKLVEYEFIYSELNKLGALVAENMKKFENYQLINFINGNVENRSIKTSNAIRHLTTLIGITNSDYENAELFTNLFAALKINFEANDIMSSATIFKGVLLFDAILIILDLELATEECHCKDIADCAFNVINTILTNSNHFQSEISYVTNEDNIFLENTEQKIKESFLNNVLQYFTRTLRYLDKYKLLIILIKIIENSNMRRPTTMSSDVFKLACQIDCSEELRNLKIKILEETLFKLIDNSATQKLTIRRNPESRLIIHALCISDCDKQKPLLAWILNYLLKILSDSTSTNAAISAAMHSIELLISDNSLYNYTLKFVPEVILQCVRMFNKDSWNVRNSTIQLTKSIIDRFYGILIGPSNRPKTIEDLLYLFPQLITQFYQTLSNGTLRNSAIIVMQFFSESQIKKKLFQNESMQIIREGFLKLFIKIIKTIGNDYGKFAVKAYVSLSLENDIPSIIGDVVSFIILNFTHIRNRHTVGNFMLLLSELHTKYNRYLTTYSVSSKHTIIMNKYLHSLRTYLMYFNSEQLDLLSVKVLSNESILKRIKCLNRNAYKDRLWLHNNLTNFIRDCSDASILFVLHEVLSTNIPECIHVKVLSIVVDKFVAKQLENVKQELLKLLVAKILRIDDQKHYLIFVYFKIISLISCSASDIKLDEDIVRLSTKKYTNVQNIYKLYSVIILLAKTNQTMNVTFVTLMLNLINNLDLYNEETGEIVSEMLPYLYKCLPCSCKRKTLLKIATFLIFEHGFWDFVTYITGTNSANSRMALIKLVNYNLIASILDNDISATFEFIAEVRQILRIKFEKCETNQSYYTEEDKEIYIDKHYKNRIFQKFLNDVKRSLPF